MKSIVDLHLEEMIESALEDGVLIADKDFFKLKNTQYKWKKIFSCVVLKSDKNLFRSFKEKMSQRCFDGDSEYFFWEKNAFEKFQSPFLRVKVK